MQENKQPPIQEPTQLLKHVPEQLLEHPTPQEPPQDEQAWVQVPWQELRQDRVQFSPQALKQVLLQLL